MAKILLVDDDADFVEATSTLLRTNGHTIVSAHNGDLGYAAARAESPDLVLLDVMMTHDSEGFDLARKLKEDPNTRNLPVVIITGIRKAKGLPFAFEPDPDWLPVRAVLEKPVRPDELIQTVTEALKG